MLIQNSTNEVGAGVRLVSDTGSALSSIGQLIAAINEHVSAIATSAREQSTGLKEINTAVNHMDQTTQQNAAMVEETNAASTSLAAEAERLRDLMVQFNLESAAGAAVRSAPPEFSQARNGLKTSRSQAGGFFMKGRT